MILSRVKIKNRKAYKVLIMSITMKQAKNSLKNVNVNQLEITLNKCLVWFYSYPRNKIGLTDLAQSINSSKTAAKLVVESLIERHFITKKIPYNLSNIYESGILDAVYKVVPSSRAVILFGSYRWGTDVEDSDIDIAVEVVDNHDLQVTHLGNIEQLGYRKNVPVNLHLFSRNKVDLNLFANIANGIVLDGFLEVRV